MWLCGAGRHMWPCVGRDKGITVIDQFLLHTGLYSEHQTVWEPHFREFVLSRCSEAEPKVERGRVSCLRSHST